MSYGTVLTRSAIGLAALLALGWGAVSGQDGGAGAYKVTINDDKPVVVESAVPIDPTKRINFNPQGLTAQITDEQNRTLHLSHFPTIMVDGQMFQVGGFGGAGGNAPGGRFEKQNQPLGKSPGGKMRQGFTTVFVHDNNLRVTFTCEVVPTKAQGKATKRRSDSVLLRYLVENKGQKTYKFGMRIYMDVYVITNDGALFAAPNQPGKLLDGVELKGKMLPDYVQMLERPNLQNPGFVSHLTLNLGTSLEKPERVVLTRHGVGFGTWEMQAVQSMGDSACGIFWEPKEIKPGGKREFAYGYGQGIVLPPEGEGQYEVKLGGSFEPGKLFTVTAVVSDPSPGQVLTLELPEGMEAVEGRTVQPVPPSTEDQANSAVMWRARVTRTGTFPLQIRSSTGLTQTKIITVEKNP
jgi:hypothetical protein